MPIRGIENFSWGGKNITISNLELDQNNEQKDQLIFGTVGHDHLIGTTSDDVIDGIGGNDRIDGGLGFDTSYIFETEENMAMVEQMTVEKI